MTTILRFILFLLLAPAFAIVAQAAGAVQDVFRIVDAGFRAESVVLGSLDGEICSYDSSGALLQQRRSIDGKDCQSRYQELETGGAKQPLFTFLAELVATNKGLPQGIRFEGEIFRAVNPKYADGAWDINRFNIGANHRYSGPGRGALYSGTSRDAVLGELRHYGVDPDAAAWLSREVSVDNILDLTNPSVRRQLGIDLSDITGDSYFIPQALGDFSRGRYNGLLVPSARQPGTSHLILLEAP